MTMMDAQSARRRVVVGARLLSADTATTVRWGDDQLLITEGPFAGGKAVFGGRYLVGAPDLDPALDLAARIPAVRLGGSVEIRPVAGP